MTNTVIQNHFTSALMLQWHTIFAGFCVDWSHWIRSGFHWP